MELSEILALVKAGYTRDEINQMAQNTAPVPDTEPVQLSIEDVTPAPEPAPRHEPEPESAPAPADPPADNQPTMAELMQSIAKLTSAVQANAIAQSVIPQGLTEPPKAEDMLAQIIRPTYNRKE